MGEEECQIANPNLKVIIDHMPGDDAAELKLADLGEREIIRRFFTSDFVGTDAVLVGPGDDAAVLRLPDANSSNIVITTDTTPPPVANSLGWKDLSILGWLSVTINISDLAAMGSAPLGIVMAVECPASTLLGDFAVFVDGLRSACRTYECPLIGGNLREAERFGATGTALGSVGNNYITRAGTRPGDVVAIVGDIGTFWASYAAVSQGISMSVQEQVCCENSLCRPRAKLVESMNLAKHGFLTSCIDISDGLSPALYAIAAASSLSISIDLDAISPDVYVRQIGETLDIDPLNFAFGFGDWNLLCTFPATALERVIAVVSKCGGSIHIIGKAERGSAAVRCKYKGRSGSLNNIDNERFASQSADRSGVSTYFDSLRKFKPIL